MLCEVVWSNDKKFLGLLGSWSNNVPLERKPLPFIRSLFGAPPIEQFPSELSWLEEKLQKVEPFTAKIWYPASLEFPEDSFESVTIRRSAAKKQRIEVYSESEQTKISILPILPNDYHSMGLKIFTKRELLDLYDVDLSTGRSFHQSLLKRIHLKAEKRDERMEGRMEERRVQKRQIYYLNDHKELEQELGLEKLHPVIKALLGGSLIEMWNAFVVVIPAGKSVPPQTIHRDSFFDSLSLFFYLDKPNEPQTRFYPFTHRLLRFSETAMEPHIEVGDLLIMDGLLCHGGMGSERIRERTNEEPRVLYVLQYRKKMSRKERVKILQERKEIIQRSQSSFPTVFQVS